MLSNCRRLCICGGPSHGFLLDRGTFTTIDFPGAGSTYATGINGLGQIIGESDGTPNLPFLLDHGSTTTISVPGALFSLARGISNRQIVGDYYGGDDQGRHGFLLDLNTSPVADSSPPVITPNIQGTLGLNGWYKSSVKVTWSVSDPESGIWSTKNCGARELTDEGGVTLTCIATNGVGLSNFVRVTIKIDKTPPSISGMPVPGCALGPPDGQLVTVATVSAIDARSGLASFDVTATSNEPSDPGRHCNHEGSRLIERL